MTKRKPKKNGQRTSRYGKIRYVSNKNRKSRKDWWNGGDAGL